MIYNIKEHTLESLSDDERLISSLMTENPTWTKAEAVEKITFAYEKCDGYRSKKQKEVANVDHPPCWKCGSTQFIRSGTCHTCQVCSETSGCS